MSVFPTPEIILGHQSSDLVTSFDARLRDLRSASKGDLQRRREAASALARDAAGRAEPGLGGVALRSLAALIDDLDSAIAALEGGAAPLPRPHHVSRALLDRPTPQSELQLWMLEALHGAPQKTLNSRRLANAVLDRNHARLTPADLEPLPHRPTTPRWRQYLANVMTRAKSEGLIDRLESGFWRLTEQGERKLADESMIEAPPPDSVVPVPDAVDALHASEQREPAHR